MTHLTTLSPFLIESKVMTIDELLATLENCCTRMITKAEVDTFLDLLRVNIPHNKNYILYSFIPTVISRIWKTSKYSYSIEIAQAFFLVSVVRFVFLEHYNDIVSDFFLSSPLLTALVTTISNNNFYSDLFYYESNNVSINSNKKICSYMKTCFDRFQESDIFDDALVFVKSFIPLIPSKDEAAKDEAKDDFQIFTKNNILFIFEHLFYRASLFNDSYKSYFNSYVQIENHLILEAYKSTKFPYCSENLAIQVFFLERDLTSPSFEFNASSIAFLNNVFEKPTMLCSVSSKCKSYINELTKLWQSKESDFLHFLLNSTSYILYNSSLIFHYFAYANAISDNVLSEVSNHKDPFVSSEIIPSILKVCSHHDAVLILESFNEKMKTIVSEPNNFTSDEIQLFANYAAAYVEALMDNVSMKSLSRNKMHIEANSLTNDGVDLLDKLFTLICVVDFPKNSALSKPQVEQVISKFREANEHSYSFGFRRKIEQKARENIEAKVSLYPSLCALTTTNQLCEGEVLDAILYLLKTKDVVFDSFFSKEEFISSGFQLLCKESYDKRIEHLDLIMELWDILSQSYFSSFSGEHFLMWCISKFKRVGYWGTILTNSQKQFLINLWEKLHAFPADKFTQTLFTLYSTITPHFWITINGLGEMGVSCVYITNDAVCDPLLWEIVFSCLDENVAKVSIDHLISLYKSTFADFHDSVNEKLLPFCLDKLSKSDRFSSCALSLLKLLLEYSVTEALEPEKKMVVSASNTTVTAIEKIDMHIKRKPRQCIINCPITITVEAFSEIIEKKLSVIVTSLCFEDGKPIHTLPASTRNKVYFMALDDGSDEIWENTVVKAEPSVFQTVNFANGTETRGVIPFLLEHFEILLELLEKNVYASEICSFLLSLPIPKKIVEMCTSEKTEFSVESTNKLHKFCFALSIVHSLLKQNKLPKECVERWKNNLPTYIEEIVVLAMKKFNDVQNSRIEDILDFVQKEWKACFDALLHSIFLLILLGPDPVSYSQLTHSCIKVFDIFFVLSKTKACDFSSFLPLLEQTTKLLQQTAVDFESFSLLCDSSVVISLQLCEEDVKVTAQIKSFFLQSLQNGENFQMALFLSMQKLFANALDYPYASDYFALLAQLLHFSSFSSFCVIENLDKAIAVLAKVTSEKKSIHYDQEILSILSLIDAILRVVISSPKFLSAESSMILLLKCIFERILFFDLAANDFSHPIHSFSTANTMETAFTIVHLVAHIPSGLNSVIEWIGKLCALQKKHLCNHHIPAALANTNRLIGLKNLGATCYANSLFQQLFFTKEFREFILSLPFDKTLKSLESDAELLEFTKLFLSMNFSHRKAISPKQLLAHLQLSSAHINVHRQMDADEFFSQLLERVESLLGDNNDLKKRLTTFFSGELMTELIPSCCSVPAQTTEPFLTLSVNISNMKGEKSSLALPDALENTMRTEVLTGQDKFFCSKCEKHSDAQKRVYLKQLPPTLFIHLCRFRYDMDTKTREKLNSHITFPDEIDFYPFTLESSLQSRSDSQEQSPTQPQALYRLCGVIVHSGSAESGHYISLVRMKNRSENEEWFRFDDSNVTLISREEMMEMSFGGKEDRYDVNMMTYQSVDKNRNAYILVYRSVKLSKSQQDVINDDLLPKLQPSQTISRCLTEIHSSSLSAMLDNLLFSNEFDIFFMKMLNSVFIQKQFNTTQNSNALFECYFAYLLNVKSKKGFQNYYQSIHKSWNLFRLIMIQNTSFISKFLDHFFSRSQGKQSTDNFFLNTFVNGQPIITKELQLSLLIAFVFLQNDKELFEETIEEYTSLLLERFHLFATSIDPSAPFFPLIYVRFQPRYDKLISSNLIRLLPQLFDLQTCSLMFSVDFQSLLARSCESVHCSARLLHTMLLKHPSINLDFYTNFDRDMNRTENELNEWDKKSFATPFGVHNYVQSEGVSNIIRFFGDVLVLFHDVRTFKSATSNANVSTNTPFCSVIRDTFNNAIRRLLECDRKSIFVEPFESAFDRSLSNLIDNAFAAIQKVQNVSIQNGEVSLEEYILGFLSHVSVSKWFFSLRAYETCPFVLGKIVLDFLPFLDFFSSKGIRISDIILLLATKYSFNLIPEFLNVKKSSEIDLDIPSSETKRKALLWSSLEIVLGEFRLNNEEIAGLLQIFSQLNTFAPYFLTEFHRFIPHVCHLASVFDLFENIYKQKKIESPETFEELCSLSMREFVYQVDEHRSKEFIDRVRYLLSLFDELDGDLSSYRVAEKVLTALHNHTIGPTLFAFFSELAQKSSSIMTDFAKSAFFFIPPAIISSADWIIPFLSLIRDIANSSKLNEKGENEGIKFLNDFLNYLDERQTFRILTHAIVDFDSVSSSNALGEFILFVSKHQSIDSLLKKKMYQQLDYFSNQFKFNASAIQLLIYFIEIDPICENLDFEELGQSLLVYANITSGFASQSFQILRQLAQKKSEDFIETSLAAFFAQLSNEQINPWLTKLCFQYCLQSPSSTVFGISDCISLFSSLLRHNRLRCDNMLAYFFDDLSVNDQVPLCLKEFSRFLLMLSIRFYNVFPRGIVIPRNFKEIFSDSLFSVCKEAFFQSVLTDFDESGESGLTISLPSDQNWETATFPVFSLTFSEIDSPQFLGHEMHNYLSSTPSPMNDVDTTDFWPLQTRSNSYLTIPLDAQFLQKQLTDLFEAIEEKERLLFLEFLKGFFFECLSRIRTITHSVYQFRYRHDEYLSTYQSFYSKLDVILVFILSQPNFVLDETFLSSAQVEYVDASIYDISFWKKHGSFFSLDSMFLARMKEMRRKRLKYDESMILQ